jgi:hypothetical protein
VSAEYDSGEYNVHITADVVDFHKAKLRATEVSPGRFSLGGMILHASASHSWDKPDMGYLGNDRKPPPTFPIELLPKFWGDWCVAHATARYTPVDYTATALLGAASGVILNRRNASAGPEWKEPTNLWVWTVGDPSDGKSPGMKPVIGLLETLERMLEIHFEPLIKQYEEDLKRYEAEKKLCYEKFSTAAAVNAPPPEGEAPTAPPEVLVPVVKVENATTEALVHILSHHDCGVIQYRDELSGFLSSMNQYRSGGAGGDRPFWTEAWQGGKYSQWRVKLGMTPLTVPKLTIATIGGIQPDVLTTLFEAKGANDGFYARPLWSWPDIVPGFKMPAKSIDNTLQAEALMRIFMLDMDYSRERGRHPKEIPFEPRALPIFEAFVRRNKARRDFGFMKGTVGKGPANAIRLAMTLSTLDWACGSKTWMALGQEWEVADPSFIATVYVENAIALMETYFYPMAERVFHEAAMSPVDVQARRLIQWLHKHRLESLNANETRRAIGGKLKTESKLMDAACQALVEAYLIKPAPSRAGDSIGRMGKNFEVNPLVFAVQQAA